jgi:DNA polymerase III epsilon subunit-like protein
VRCAVSETPSSELPAVDTPPAAPVATSSEYLDKRIERFGAEMSKLKIPFDIVLLDLETNGKDVPDVRIVEIGAVRLDRQLKITNQFSQLIDGRPMTSEATAVNTITDAMLEGAPNFFEGSGRFLEWCRKAGKDYLLSSWGTYFDITVLRSEYRRINVKYPHPGRALDAKALAWAWTWTTENPSGTGGVGSIAKRLGLPFEGTPHRALDDARMSAKILRAIAERIGLCETS